VGPELLTYADCAGRLCAEANQVLVSGGAKGIDQASMRGALDADGRAIGVLADSLDRAALAREHRTLLMEERLVLVSPYDPSAGFNVGHAMQRNKLIYAFADAALVVNSDFQKGGTWAGAVEQLDKLRFVPVYVRPPSNGEKGMEGLRRKGARLWPESMEPRDLKTLLADTATSPVRDGGALELIYGEAPLPTVPDTPIKAELVIPSALSESTKDPIPPLELVPMAPKLSPPETLFEAVRQLVIGMVEPVDEISLVERLGIEKGQAKVWLKRLIQEGVVKKVAKKKVQRPKPATDQQPLFEDQS
jgi:predicted Rossmann fold nucleotide-binding protein DprA/Smf involved in DNA uptake